MEKAISLRSAKLKEALQDYLRSTVEAGRGLIDGLLGAEPLFAQRGLHQNFVGKPFQAHSILVIRPDEIGDVILTTAFLRELRHNAPDAWITLMVKPGTYNLVEHCPYVNEILAFAWPSSMRYPSLKEVRNLVPVCASLWDKQFDLCILPRYDWDRYQSTLVAWLSGAKQRVAYTEKVNHGKMHINQGFDRLLTHAMPGGGARHEVLRPLDMLRFLGGHVDSEKLELWTDGEDEAYARRVLGDTVKTYIALSPGVPVDSRVWPPENYIEVCRLLAEKNDVHFLIFGGPGEEASGRLLQKALPALVTDLTARTTLRQAAAILRKCSLYMGRDTGVMHMAAAAGCPVAAVFSHPQSGNPIYISPQRFGPWGVPRVILQPNRPLPPCQDACRQPGPHCITQIAPGAVAAATLQLLTNPETGEIASSKSADGHFQALNLAQQRSRSVQKPEIKIVTSLSTANLEHQKNALETWKKEKCRIVSLNAPDVIRQLQPLFAGVEFVEVKRDARSKYGNPVLYFDDIADYLRQSGDEICSIVNPDIAFLQPGLFSFLHKEARGAFVYGARVDVPSLDYLDGKFYLYGFDFFFFDAKVLASYPPDEFCLGMPWWDFWVLLNALKAGFPLKRIVSPVAYHVQHAVQWPPGSGEYLARRMAARIPPPFPFDVSSIPTYLRLLAGTVEKHSKPISPSPFQDGEE